MVDESQPDPEELLHDLRNRAIARRVSCTRLAANSVLIYIDATPGAGNGVTFWLEPTWHLRGPDSVLTGSQQAQDHDGGPDADSGFRRAAAALDSLDGRTVLDVRVEPITGDLLIDFEGAFLLRTFVSDPTAEEFWHVRDNAIKRYVARTSTGFEIWTDP